MRPILSLVLLALTALLSVRTSWATEIDGKWGLGVAVGSLVSSSAEASILRGMSTRTAWLLDVSASLSNDNRNVTNRTSSPDTTVGGAVRSEGMSIIVGPRLRMFTRPESSFSPYWDVYAHFTDRYQIGSSPGGSFNSRTVGGEAGLAIGVEYFSTRWPFSVGARTDFARFGAVHTSLKASDDFGNSQVSSGSAITGTVSFNPSLQVRVYF